MSTALYWPSGGCLPLLTMSLDAFFCDASFKSLKIKEKVVHSLGSAYIWIACDVLWFICWAWLTPSPLEKRAHFSRFCVRGLSIAFLTSTNLQKNIICPLNCIQWSASIPSHRLALKNCAPFLLNWCGKSYVAHAIYDATTPYFARQVLCAQSCVCVRVICNLPQVLRSH